MKTWSSSSMRLFDRHCPAALGFHEAGVPRDREGFATGIAAHACLEALVRDMRRRSRIPTPNERSAVLDETVAKLTSEGRVYAGELEPPISPSHATAGRDIVAGYLRKKPWEEGSLPFCHDAEPELGLAIDAQGEAVEFGSENARWRAILDAVEVDIIGEAVVAWEYKTAWSTTAAELDTIQTRGHAVLLAANYPGLTVFRRVINLRTGYLYDDVTDGPVIDQWRRDILAACDAADKSRTPRPGAGCLGCPWILSCEAADYVDDPAVRYVDHRAKADELARRLRVETEEGPIPVPGGVVGYQARDKAVPVEDVHVRLASEWMDEVPTEAWRNRNASWLSLLASLNIGATGVRSAAKTMRPGRKEVRERTRIAESMLRTESTATFGIWKE